MSGRRAAQLLPPALGVQVSPPQFQMWKEEGGAGPHRRGQHSTATTHTAQAVLLQARRPAPQHVPQAVYILVSPSAQGQCVLPLQGLRITACRLLWGLCRLLASFSRLRAGTRAQKYTEVCFPVWLRESTFSCLDYLSPSPFTNPDLWNIFLTLWLCPSKK